MSEREGRVSIMIVMRTNKEEVGVGVTGHPILCENCHGIHLSSSQSQHPLPIQNCLVRPRSLSCTGGDPRSVGEIEDCVSIMIVIRTNKEEAQPKAMCKMQ